MSNKMLENIFEGLNRDLENTNKRREQRVWKKIDIKCNLTECLALLTKSELDEIRRNLDLKGLSSLKKGELIEELSNLIPIHIQKIIFSLDQERYDLFKKAIQNSGYVPACDFSIDQAECLQEYSLAFSGIYKNEKVLVIPKEIILAFQNINEMEIKIAVKRNTEWVKLTFGMVYYYGVINTSYAISQIEKLTNQTIDIIDYYDVMAFANDYYGQAYLTSYGLEHKDVRDAKQLLDQQSSRVGVNYYPFTKEMLLNAGELGYIDRTPAMNQFIDFIMNNFDITLSETEEIAQKLNKFIKMDTPPTALMKYLENQLEFPSFEFVQELTDIVMELNNQTRMWKLKGNSPYDLRPRSTKTLQQQPIISTTKAVPTRAKVVDIRSKKIGRNQPCPCGSGKKYKKCCGK